MTPAADLPTSINDTGGKFATGGNNTGNNFATCVMCQQHRRKIATGINDTGVKLATGVNDTCGKQWEQYQTADL
jgi:hypothetical protein